MYNINNSIKTVLNRKGLHPLMLQGVKDSHLEATTFLFYFHLCGYIVTRDLSIKISQCTEGSIKKLSKQII